MATIIDDLFSYTKVKEGYGCDIFEGIVLKEHIGDLEKGTKISSAIIFYREGTLTFWLGDHSKKFKVKVCV